MAGSTKQSPFDPAILDRLAGLDFVARTVVEGFLAGGHRSPKKGSSPEFAQHREYAPGDDLRHVDWRIFAKSQRLVVKEYHEESNLIANLAIDTSGSMGFGSSAARTSGWSKLDYARWVAAALGHLILGQRDSVGLVEFDTRCTHHLPPGGGAPQRQALIEVLESTEPGGETEEGPCFEELARHMPGRGIAVLISDFLGELEPMFSGLEALVAGGHEPLLLQVLDRRELDFDYEGYLRLEDLEGGANLKVDARVLAEAYREEVDAHQAALMRHAGALGLDLVTMVTDTGVDTALAAYLARRSARVTRHAGGL